MIEKVVNFFDPRNDFVSYDQGEDFLSKTVFKDDSTYITRTRTLMTGLLKSVCRGLGVGAIAGAAVGVASSPFLDCSYDEAVSINTATGALLGFAIDSAQYGARMLYKVGVRTKNAFFNRRSS
jgi:hypothetical protein